MVRSRNRDLLDERFSTPAPSSAPKPPTEFNCDHCGALLLYGKAVTNPIDNHIVGRSKVGGYVCRDCYEKSPNFDYRDRAFREFDERHKHDEWAAIIGASRDLRTNADRRDLLAILKRKARAIGNPETVERVRNVA